MKRFLIGVAVSGLLVACSAETPTVDTSPVENIQAEPPFYTVDNNGTGPLTMPELQINIPDEIDSKLSDKRRACHMKAIEDLAAKAGDPEALNPADVDYLPTDGSWQELTRFGRRNILAQAVVSRAFAVC